MVATGGTVGLAKGIIDDKCLVSPFLQRYMHVHNHVASGKGHLMNGEKISISIQV